MTSKLLEAHAQLQQAIAWGADGLRDETADQTITGLLNRMGAVSNLLAEQIAADLSGSADVAASMELDGDVVVWVEDGDDGVRRTVALTSEVCGTCDEEVFSLSDNTKVAIGGHWTHQH